MAARYLAPAPPMVTLPYCVPDWLPPLLLLDPEPLLLEPEPLEF
jgi:hypothetical protein